MFWTVKYNFIRDYFSVLISAINVSSSRQHFVMYQFGNSHVPSVADKYRPSVVQFH